VSWRRQQLPQWEDELIGFNRAQQLLLNKNKKIKTWLSRRLQATRYRVLTQSQQYFAAPFCGARFSFYLRVRLKKRPDRWRWWKKSVRAPQAITSFPENAQHLSVPKATVLHRIAINSRTRFALRCTRRNPNFDTAAKRNAPNYSYELQQTLAVATDKFLHSRKHRSQRNASKYPTIYAEGGSSHTKILRLILHARTKSIRRRLLKDYASSSEVSGGLKKIIKNLTQVVRQNFNVPSPDVDNAAPSRSAARRHKKAYGQWNVWFNSRAKTTKRMFYRTARQVCFRRRQRNHRAKHKENLLLALEDLYTWQQRPN
jgi:hypothetical protein